MEIQKIQQYSTQSLMQDLRQIIEQARGHSVRVPEWRGPETEVV